MRRMACVALAVLVLVSAAGCFGPQKLTRRMDDLFNDLYVESPWVWGNVVSGAVMQAVLAVTWAVDGVLNVYYFWLVDAWPLGRGTGEPYLRKPPLVPEGN